MNVKYVIILLKILAISNNLVLIYKNKIYEINVKII